MIGAIAGDVIGSVYEHSNIKSTDFPLFQKSSRFTDDSVMSLALADALVHGRDIAQNFRRFYGWYPRVGYGNLFKAWAKDASFGAYNSYGNGSAMRVAASAYAFDTAEQVLACARESAVITHNHPEGIKGAEAIALGTFLARTGHTKSEILSNIVDQSGYHLEFSLDEIRDDYFFDTTCQGSVPQALVAFREGKDFEDTIRLAISIGGDSDTIACMTGALSAAFYQFIPDVIEIEVRARLDERLAGVLRLFEEKFLL